MVSAVLFFDGFVFEFLALSFASTYCTYLLFFSPASCGLWASLRT